MEPIEAHSNLFGVKVPPTERQKAFYSNAAARGFSSKECDPELTDATLIRALAQVIDPGEKGVYHKVYLFFPEDQKSWVASRIHNLAKTTMTRMQPILKDERGKRAITHVRQWLEVIQLGSVDHWKGPAPERWAAFGYRLDDPGLPEWLKAALV